MTIILNLYPLIHIHHALTNNLRLSTSIAWQSQRCSLLPDGLSHLSNSDHHPLLSFAKHSKHVKLGLPPPIQPTIFGPKPLPSCAVPEIRAD